MAIAVPVTVMTTAPSMPRPWDTGLCGCFEDCGSLCMSWCFPCVQYGLNSEKINPNSSCFVNCCLYSICMSIGCCCILHGQKRAELRRKYNLMSDCDDCCVTMWCSCCALAQEARQLEKMANAPPVQTMGVTTITTQPVMYGSPVQAGYPQQAPMYSPQGYQQQPQQGYPQQGYQQQQPYSPNYQGPPQTYGTYQQSAPQQYPVASENPYPTAASAASPQYGSSNEGQ
jgi:Cys-rich protein (TIGR01571 family)